MDTEIIGMIAGVLSCITFVPQIFKTFATKKVDDISLGTFYIIFVSTLLWLYYGIQKNLPSVIWTNVIVNISALAMIIMKYVFSKNSNEP